VIEPSQEAQDEYIRHLRSVAIDNSDYVNECTPSYFNNEGDETKKRHIFGEPWGEGYYAFEAMIEKWREDGALEGLMVTPERQMQPAE
jgi:cyclohexanone monooxygenase